MCKTINIGIFIIISAFLMLQCQGFSISGPWKLEVDASYKNIDPNTSIVFDFSKQIVNGTIINQLTVLACSVIQFNYTIDNSIATFILSRIGVNRRQCVRDQVTQIIKRIEKVAFTSTVGNILMFLSPSGKILLKMSKVQTDKNLKTLPGVWQVNRLLDQNSNIIIKANSSIIQFCQGNAAVQYKIISSNEIDFRIKQAKGCPENDLLTALYRTKYFRQYNDQLLFYSQNVDLLMKWNNLDQLPADKPLVFQNPFNKPSVFSSQSQVNLNIKVTNSISEKDSLQKVQKKQLSSNTPTITTISTQTKEQKPISPNSTKQTVKIADSPKIDEFDKNMKKQDVIRKWIILGASETGNSSSILTITANTMAINQCGVWIALYNLRPVLNGVAEIASLQVRNTVPSCVGKKGPIEEYFTNLKYLTVRLNEKGDKILQFRNKDQKVIAEWGFNSKLLR